MAPADEQARLDKWLWTARFFKTRSLAAQAIEGGKVLVNEERPKRAKTVRPGDAIRLRLGPFEHRVTVRAIGRTRGSAALAAELYLEDPDGKAARERLAEQHRLAAKLHGGELPGRPTKKDRREIDRLRRR